MPTTLDPEEIRKFEKMSHEWWDPLGKFKPLHQLNPVRTEYICRHMVGNDKTDLTGLRLLDVGCGGGILSEALSQRGATIIAIDRSEKMIGAARAHQKTSQSQVDYRVQSPKELVKDPDARFDAVLAMEVIEHVADVGAFIKDCVALLKPGGQLFLATINRTPKAWLFAIAGAEYLLRWLPRGTHQFDKLVRPSELRRHLEQNHVQLQEIVGVRYIPWRDAWQISDDTDVNYLGYGVLTQET